MTAPSEQFTGVQILRFVAAMLVVVMHVTQAISIHITGQGEHRFWAPGGSGVDIFFVISGFVMAITTQRLPSTGPARLAAAWVFIKRRILRIVPLYWFYTLLKAALLLAVPALASKSVFDGGHLAASLLFIPAMSPSGLIQPTLQVGWTLNFEMLFYTVFAIAIALGAPRIRFCLLVFLTLFLAGQHFPQTTVLAFYAQNVIFEFILGVAIAWFYTRRGPLPPAVSVAFLVAGALFMFGPDWSSWTQRLFPWGLGAAALVLGVVGLERWIAKAPGARPLAFLGDASYSLYLAHAFVVPAGVLALRRVGLVETTTVLALVSLMSIAASVLSHVWLEKPMTSFFKRFLFREPTRAYPHAANTPVK